MAPTQAQLSAAYSSLANRCFKDGKAVTLDAAPQGLAGIKPLPFRDAQGAIAEDKHIYIIKGEVYVKTTTQNPQQAQQTEVTKWQKVGKANITF